jgi:hypothetical protein
MKESQGAARRDFVAQLDGLVSGRNSGGGSKPPGAPTGAKNGAAASLADIAAILRAQLPASTTASADGLGGRIAARRAQIVGARGPVPYDRVRVAVMRESPTAWDVPVSTGDLPSSQQLLVAQVEPAAAAAQSILEALVPSRVGRVDQAEVAAVVTKTANALGALRAEALTRDPREELVDVRRENLRRLRLRLRRVMAPRRDPDDRFRSREDLEQENRLTMFERHLTVVEQAWDEYFVAAWRSPPAMDRVSGVQDQLRVVGDTAAVLRQRLNEAGVRETELAAPEARLYRIDKTLPRMTMASLLTWIAELGGGREAADLPTTGSLGLASIKSEATSLLEIIEDLRKTADGSPAGSSTGAGSGALAAALRDGGVKKALDALLLQLETVVTTAGGRR